MKDAIKEFWEEDGGVGEVYDVGAECVTLERMDANELKERTNRKEVVKCVKRHKNDKAAGLDDIPYEFYKNGDEIMTDRMTELCNQVREEERVPKKY